MNAEEGLNKELLQEVIDRLKPSYPDKEYFERDLRSFIEGYKNIEKEGYRNIRFSCENQNIENNE